MRIKDIFDNPEQVNKYFLPDPKNIDTPDLFDVNLIRYIAKIYLGSNYEITVSAEIDDYYNQKDIYLCISKNKEILFLTILASKIRGQEIRRKKNWYQFISFLSKELGYG